ncbi:MAG TPA: adenylate/guanylate cyclase domain-containing protein [Terriglobales bacterium]|nr:adenylate/guanylate cyclase domain-containing protein [Terriglobales bacterium]
MVNQAVARRLAAIMTADVVSYSRLMGADEVGTLSSLKAHRRNLIDPAIAGHHGRIVKTTGDGLLVEFASVVDAVACAVAVQRGMLSRNAEEPEDKRIVFRIGINVGDVIIDGDDIFGDGVNVAARLESLCEPGGVCISRTANDQVRDKLSLPFTDLGEQTVKNIAYPVGVFGLAAKDIAALPEQELPQAPTAKPAVEVGPPPRRRAVLFAATAILVIFVAAGAWLAWQHRSNPTGNLALADRPSIAVLPFDNMGGDPEQAYFADGMTEDLITDLSKVAGLLVIARNSTFAYKGKARDIREIAKALGVRYVLEGSVRRSGADIRVNAQLIDATTGGHVWADRYDGEMKNIFGLQDKVTRNVVTALAVTLTSEDRERVARRSTENAEAYDVFLKGWQHYLRQTPDDFRTATDYFKKAVDLDPKYSRAYAALAATYWETYRRAWGLALGVTRSSSDARYQAEQFLAKAMQDPTPLAHQVASAILLHSQQHDEAIAEAKLAIAGDPNDAEGYIAMAHVLSFAGKAGEALELVERAIRLNPHYPAYYLYQLGLAQFGMNRLDPAAASLERAIAVSGDDYWSQRLLLATYGLLGRLTDASKLLEALKGKDQRGLIANQDPLTIKALAFWYPFAKPADAERFAEGLRKAGMPE